MNIKILTDSACDLPEELLDNKNLIPITIRIDGKDYKDGIDLRKKEFYSKLTSSKNFPGTASPSPGTIIEKFSDAEKVYILTVSSALSSTYNNALLAKDIYTKELRNKMVYVIDSLNASIGQGLIFLKLKQLIENNLSHQNIIEKIEDYIKEVKTFFILENMDNLINSGRINKLLGKIVNVLNIKLIMGRTDEGKIELYKKVRGSRKAFNKLLNIIGNYGNNFEDKIFGIAHFNCLDKAKKFKAEVEKKYNFKDIIITQIGPSIATYADEDAIIISF
jgi:DegV family protein with EDD domain